MADTETTLEEEQTNITENSVVTKRIVALEEQQSPASGDVMIVDNPSSGTKKISVANLQDSTLDNIENKTFSFDNGDATIVTEINNINDRIDSMDLSGGLFASGSLTTVSTLADFQSYLLSLETGTVMGCITATTDIDDGGNITVLYSGKNMIVASIGSGNIFGLLSSSNDYKRVVGVSYNNSVWNYGYIGVMEGTGSNSEIFNNVINTASGNHSHAEGYDTTASGNYSHSEGNNTIASGTYSHAEGRKTTAYGLYSHAEGGNTQAQDWAHAEGDHTIASGTYAHTEGYYTTASYSAAHAEGHQTVASGNYSHVEGYNTVSASDNQHVEGSYNIADENGTYVHIVGNGTSENARSNAHTLDWSGNAWFAGDVVDGLGNVLSEKLNASDADLSITKANELYDHYNKCKSITALPTELYSYNFTVATSISSSVATLPQYSKGVFVTTGNDGIIMAVHYSGSIYCAYRNGSTWGDIYEMSVSNVGKTIRHNGAYNNVADNTTTTTHSINLTAGTWLITGYIQWGSGFTQNYNHTISCNGKEHTVRNVGTNGGGTSNVMIITLTNSATATQSVWQNSGSSKNVGAPSELMAVRIK